MHLSFLCVSSQLDSSVLFSSSAKTSIVWMCSSVFIRSPTEGCLGCLQVSAVMNSVNGLACYHLKASDPRVLSVLSCCRSHSESWGQGLGPGVRPTSGWAGVEPRHTAAAFWCHCSVWRGNGGSEESLINTIAHTVFECKASSDLFVLSYFFCSATMSF